MNDDSAIKLADLFGAINRKDRDWWERLNQEQQSKFSSWLYSRYMSIVRHPNPDMHRYYVIAANSILNVNISSLTKKHTKLIYLLMTTIPNEYTRVDHQYIPPMKKNQADKKTNSKIKILTDIYSTYKEKDIETLASLMSDKEFEELLVEHGWDNKK